MSICMEILPPLDLRIKRTVPLSMRRWISYFAQRAAALASVTTGNWVIHLVDDRRMIQYHQQTMNLATTTDVLTFNYTDEHIPQAPLDLETIICADEAQRQAMARDHRLPELEMLLYAVHSLLHCIGYDDRTRRQALRMHRREDFILRQMGLPAVYFTGAKTVQNTPARGRRTNNAAVSSRTRRSTGSRRGGRR